MSLVDTAAAPAGQHAPSMAPMFMILAVIVLFYFWMWRQQSRKTKGHLQFIDSLNKGDEVVTNGGIAGKVSRIEGDYIALRVAKETEIMVQKPAISSLLPKGTIKLLD